MVIFRLSGSWNCVVSCRVSDLPNAMWMFDEKNVHDHSSQEEAQVKDTVLC